MSFTWPWRGEGCDLRGGAPRPITAPPRTCEFLAEVIVCESARRFGPCPAFFSLCCLCFKAACAHFSPQPKPLDARCRQRFTRAPWEVSPKPPLASPQLTSNSGGGGAVFTLFYCICRHFGAVITCRSPAILKAQCLSFHLSAYARLRSAKGIALWRWKSC